MTAIVDSRDSRPDGARSLLMVLPSLGGGGAERAAVDLIQGLNRRQWIITLALFSATGRFLPQVPPDVRIVDLNGKPSYDLRLVWRLARLMRRERPAVIFSILRYANLQTLLARRLAGIQARVVINEQNLPSAEFAQFGGGKFKTLALRWLYPQADAVTTISQGIAAELSALCQLPQESIAVIPNPVAIDRVVRLGTMQPDHPWFDGSDPVIVAVGRLHPQKGFVHLIRAFALVRQSLPCKLIIIGEGPQRSELERLVDEHGLSSDVALPGFQDNPYGYMAHATAFVLSSIYEGFGTVLIEALALGTPIVSTRCPVGPEEILVDGETGLLVPPADEAALAKAMRFLMQEDGVRRRLASAGRLRASAYRLENVVLQYQNLLQTVVDGDSPCVS